MNIKIMNGHADNANIELLTAVSPSNFECDIRFDELSADEKTTYNDGIGVFVQDCICTIENSPYELDMQRMTSDAINVVVDEITESTLDYLTLSAADQTKLDDFNQLLIDKCW